LQAYQCQRTAHHNLHLFPPRTNLIGNFAQMNGVFRPATDLPAEGLTSRGQIYLKAPSR
jgi:hypothetical protein